MWDLPSAVGRHMGVNNEASPFNFSSAMSKNVPFVLYLLCMWTYK